MSFLETLTDDQLALVGCATAFLAAFALMTVMGSIRPAQQRRDVAADDAASTPAAPATVARKQAA